jgi:TolC family type I secretion outer membrane protein
LLAIDKDVGSVMVIQEVKTDREFEKNKISFEMKRIVSIAAVAVTCGISSITVNAQTIEEALSNAYLTNPGLRAARAELRATDESVNQAISNWRPNVEFTTSAGFNRVDSASGFFGSRGLHKPKSGEISVAQSLYRGGQTVAETEQREFEIQAQRAELTSVEQGVLLDAATAYMNVVRDQAVVELQINNEKVLLRQLEATTDRFSVGEVTRTDVSQAEARLARAKADRIQAEGDLENARTVFERVIGIPPADLKSPNLKYELPEALETAISEASKKSPNVVSALFVEKAARKYVRKVTGELLPEVSLEGSLRKSADQSSAGSTNESAQILATLTIPLYQQGAVSSRVREAKQRAAQRRLEYLDEQRAAIETSRSAWEDLQTARARIEAFKIEIESSEIALEGVRQEANVGSRTVLDVLDAEQELLDAQVNLVRAERDEFVAATELAAAVGTLTAKEYRLDVDYYNEIEHYNKVRDKIYGFGK